MKPKTLLMLVVLAGLLGAGAWWTIQKESAAPPAMVGSQVLPALPINAVNKIIIQTSATNTIIAKTQGLWRVVNRFEYPAKFDKIVEVLQELSALKIGQLVAASEVQLEQFDLLPPAPEAQQPLAAKTGSLLQLFDAQDQMLASLLIGKHFMRPPPAGQPSSPFALGGYPGGQYVRTASGQVLLVTQTLDQLTEDVKYWLDDEFINVAAQDIIEMSVTGPGRNAILLQRETADAALKLMDTAANEDSLDTAKLNQLAGALQYLSFDDVAAPTLPAEETGLDQPNIIKVRTKQGQIYILSVGNTVNPDNFDRYMQVSLAYEPPPQASITAAEGGLENEAEQLAQKADSAASEILAEQTKTLHSKLSPWIYVLKSYRAESLLIKREDLIKQPEPLKSDNAARALPLGPSAGGSAQPLVCAKNIVSQAV